MNFLRRLNERLHSLFPARKVLSPQKVGMRGEQEAVRYLKRKGYTILERNFRTRSGEIDIIAFRDGVLVFAEVRSRTEPYDPHPLETINDRKRRRIAAAARIYCRRHRMEQQDVTPRFDVIGVIFPRGDTDPVVQHVEDAFRP